MKPWILSSAPRDLAWLVLPGPLGWAVARLIPDFTAAMTVFLFLCLAVVDSGHVYTTVLRTYANPSERPHPLYLWTPPLVVALFATWYALGLPYLWTFVLYSTLFHHVRQYFGICRWYQKLHGRFCPWSGRFLYALTVAPLLLYHVRLGARGAFYSDHDFLLYPDSRWFDGGLYVYGALVALWVAFEARLGAAGRREPGRLLSVLTPALTYALAFLTGENAAQVAGPLVLGHGLGYFALMALALPRTQPARYPSLKRAWLLVGLVAVVAGPLEAAVEEYWLDFESKRAAGWLSALGLGLYLVPLFCHFVFDAVLWRAGHREAADLYQKERAAPERRPIRNSA